MTVTLFSSHLVAIIAKWLPKSNKAMTDTNPKILGQQLVLATDTIRSYKIEEESENSAGTAENLEESENSVATAKKLKESKSTSSTAKKLEKSENTASTAKLEESENSVATAKLHVAHLLRFLEKEYKDTGLQYDRMTQEGTRSWSMLWAFLPPGEKVCYNCQFSGQQVCGNVRLRHYYKHHVTGTKRLHVELDVMDYDGQSYRACNVRAEKF